MKKLLAFVIGAIALTSTLPVFAGPDWQVIEQGRKNQQATQAEQARTGDKCAMRLVLPLDHGPHAQSTPYLNEQRKANFEAGQKACKEAAAKGTT
jgi:hypothetical protein